MTKKVIIREAVAIKLHSPKTCEKLIFVNNIRYNFHQVFAIVSCWEAFRHTGYKDPPIHVNRLFPFICFESIQEKNTKKHLVHTLSCKEGRKIAIYNEG